MRHDGSVDSLDLDAQVGEAEHPPRVSMRGVSDEYLSRGGASLKPSRQIYHRAHDGELAVLPRAHLAKENLAAVYSGGDAKVQPLGGVTYLDGGSDGAFRVVLMGVRRAKHG